jgi:hypothetical protein
MTLERSQGEQKIPLSPQEKGVFANFYLSFHHSQGRGDLQDSLFQYTAGYYQKENPLMGEIKPLDEKIITNFLSSLKVPQVHLTRSRFISDSGTFLYEWGQLKSTLMASPRELPSGDSLLFDLAKGIIERDLEYQEEERPLRKNGDIHESFLRSYLFGFRTPQTPLYATLYTDIGNLLNRLRLLQPNPYEEQATVELSHHHQTDLENIFGEMVEAWERNHPGESFVPTDASLIQTGV